MTALRTHRCWHCWAARACGGAARARGAQAKGRLAELAARVPIPHGTEGLVESCWLLLTSVVAVPIVCSFPGGSAVLGFLARARRRDMGSVRSPAPAAPCSASPAGRAAAAAAGPAGPARVPCCTPCDWSPGARASCASTRPAMNHAHRRLPGAARRAARWSAPARRRLAGLLTPRRLG